MSTFTPYTTNPNGLLQALQGTGTGLEMIGSSLLVAASGPSAISYYDGSLTALGMGAGVLMTSGTIPGTSNTVGWFGEDNQVNGDADIDAVVNTVFQTLSYDASTLEFDFRATDPNATSISFDLVFGSDEYPEWVDLFVDSAVVLVNGVNYALFSHDPSHPLSVVGSNLAAGYFQDNSNNSLPIEYDGVSHVLKIVAPILGNQQLNHIKIGIADTGDHIYDSGLFIANMTAGYIPGSGVLAVTDKPCSDADDDVVGSAQDEYFDLQGGNDTLYAGAGDDIVMAGPGDDHLYGGSGNDQLMGNAGNDHLNGGDGIDTATFNGLHTDFFISTNATTGALMLIDQQPNDGNEGSDELLGIEQFQFADGLFSLESNGSWGAVLPPTPPTANLPGNVFITGLGIAGQALTVVVSDPDGIDESSISYEWQVSVDEGENWSSLGNTDSSYTVTDADIGYQFQVTVQYTDQQGYLETAVSDSKSVLDNTGTGDLVVTLLQLNAPPGATTLTPITTLIANAIALGNSPNVALHHIQQGLGLPTGISLQNYDAYHILQNTPDDATALLVEKIAVQIAICTSLSDDDTGMNLTTAILKAVDAGIGIDLSNIDDLAALLGTSNLPDPTTGKYPEPLNEIFDRNKSMSDAIADGKGLTAIETEWQDLLSLNDGIASTSIADLSIHINQAPTGQATAVLANGLENSNYSFDTAALLSGFSDPENEELFISGLSSDSGMVVDDQDGTWSFVPDTNYSGPVELSYQVLDAQGLATTASQMLIIASTTPQPPLTNILEPNFFATLTPKSPQWTISTDMVAKVTDAVGHQTLLIAPGGKLDLDGALGNNTIIFDGLSSQNIQVERSGQEVKVKLLDTGETIASIPATHEAQTMRFVDTDQILQLGAQGPTWGGTPIPSEAMLPALIFTADPTTSTAVLSGVPQTAVNNLGDWFVA